MLKKNYKEKTKIITKSNWHKIDESKDKKQGYRKLEQANQDLNKKLLKKDEEQSCLKNHSENSLAKIKKSKDKKRDAKKIEQENQGLEKKIYEKDKSSHLNNHNV